jgi:N,N'-diacetyllegionaminate synthase
VKRESHYGTEEVIALPQAVFELGLNHLGDTNRARRMVDALVAQGATHMTLQVITDSSSFARDFSQIRALQRNCLSLGDNLDVLQYAANSGLQVGAAVLEPGIVPDLLKTGVRFFKVLSSDITFHPLLCALSSTGKPVYVSTGASTIEEIAAAIQAMRAASPDADVRLIHTVLKVPTPLGLLNLRNIQELSDTFGMPVAYGQHSDNEQALYIAAALGAQALFVYVAEEYGPGLPDGPNAILCRDIGSFLQRVKEIETMLGSRTRIVSDEEAAVRKVVRRSVVAARPIQKGTRIIEASIAYKRPGTGLPPQHVDRILGTVATRDYSQDDDVLAEEALED